MRKCLVIGSSNYDDGFDELSGAKADAENVYALLTNPDHGAYAASSVKLIDPTLNEVRAALASLVLSDPPLEVFTFYFAGHGEVTGGSFYMLLRDSKDRQLSWTALGINDVFSQVNEGRPQQVNIVIDACRAGGVALDLSQVIKVESLGTHISPNISLFAAAHMYQAAEETDEGGAATTALARVLRGDEATASSAKYLDLVGVGMHVAAKMAESGIAQAPIVWGLNLTGLSRFALNPHAAHEQSILPTLGVIAGTTGHAPIAQRLEARRDSLWRTYLDLGREVDLSALSNELAAAVQLLEPGTGQSSDFVLGLSYSLPIRARTGGEPFADAEVLAVCAAVLLPVAKVDPKAAAAVEDIAKRFVGAVDAELLALDEVLAANWRAMLSRQSGYGEFILLPLRLSRLLGYMGVAETIVDILGFNRTPEIEPATTRIIERVAQDFEGSLVCLSDQQATYLATFFASPLASRCRPEAERIFGLMCADFFSRRGRVLSAEFSGASAFQYCWALETNTPMPTTVSLAVPTTLLAVFLTTAARLGLVEAVDPYLRLIDHHSTNIYIPENLENFLSPSIPNGVNITLSVGGEHSLGIFTVADYQENFDTYCRPPLETLNNQITDSERASALLACLVRPDRILWTDFPPVSAG